MTKRQQRQFIRELTSNVLRDVLNKVPAMPAQWDGIELRMYLADRFKDAVMARPGEGVGRKRAYTRTCRERNL